MKPLSLLDARICRVVLVALLGLCPLDAIAVEASVAPRAADESPTKSQELMKQGAARYAQGDWHGAYLAYREAWDLTPHPAVAANMAASEIKLGLYLEAASHLKYALSHLPPVQGHKRGAVEEQLDRVRAHLVTVSLSANLEGVEISIDGKTIGRTPLLEEVLLEPGEHTIRAEYADLTQTKAIDLNAGARVALLFDLNGTESSSRRALAAEPSQPFASDTGPERTRTWALVGGAVATAISLGVGITMRIQANQESEDAETLRAQINSAGPSSGTLIGETCARRDQSQACDLLYRNVQAVDRDRAISTGALLAAGVLGVATAATALLWPPRKNSGRASANRSQLHMVPWSVGNGCGVGASLSF